MERKELTSLTRLLLAGDALGVTEWWAVTLAAAFPTLHTSVVCHAETAVAIAARCIRGVLFALLFVRTVDQIANRSRVALVDKLRRRRHLADIRSAQMLERGYARDSSEAPRHVEASRSFTFGLSGA